MTRWCCSIRGFVRRSIWRTICRSFQGWATLSIWDLLGRRGCAVRLPQSGASLHPLVAYDPPQFCQPLQPRTSLAYVRFQLGVGSPPDIDHELVRVYRLLTLAQTLRDAAALQDAEDEEWGDRRVRLPPVQTQRSSTAPACRACPRDVSSRASVSFS